MVWDEDKHPRDKKGQFTYSDSGVLKGRIEKTEDEENKGGLANLFNGFDLGEAKDILLDVLGNIVPEGIKLSANILQLNNLVKSNNLQDKLIKEIKMAKVKKERNKHVSLGNNSNNNNSKSKLQSNTKIRGVGDVLYKTSKTIKELKEKEDEYKSILLNVLGKKATQGDVLYGKLEELEKKVKEYGLEDKLLKISFIEGKPTGFGINNINQENTKNNSKEYVKPTTIGRITSPYGNRIHPVYKTTKLHDGIDIGVPIGTPVGAVSNGKVTYVGKKTGYGNYIEVQYKNSNGDNITTFYAHLNDFKTKDGKTLKVGQTVKQGEQIGHSGNTGIGTGAHLHLGARKNGEKINPIDIIGNVYPKK